MRSSRENGVMSAVTIPRSSGWGTSFMVPRLVPMENENMNGEFRTETDTMGEMRVPSQALYGAQTARALENFPISGLRFPRSFIRALGLVKSAAAQVNGMPAVQAAADEVVEGRHDGEFAIDIFQTGSGTSTNMNANEVIGRLAHAH